MKFVHMADMHFDIPFTTLNESADLGIQRRLQQRKVFKDIIEYVKENDILYLLIAGDLYEQEYMRKTTMDYINDLFKQIPDTTIFITPGNHDPYIKNSFYYRYPFHENVHIFTNEIERYETEEIDFYGYGFSDFYQRNNLLSQIKIKNPNKINILITHGAIDGGAEEDKEYNPMKLAQLKQLGFDYIALGHIHKPFYHDYENQNIVYPGSTISLGFDELGSHGIIIGQLEKGKLDLRFKKMDQNQFEEIKMDISEVNTIEELIEKIDQLSFNPDNFYKIILIGKRKLEINIYEIFKLIHLKNIIKIKDNSIAEYSIEKTAQEINLKGLFAQEILNEINQEKIDKNKLEKVFEIGMEILNQ